MTESTGDLAAIERLVVLMARHVTQDDVVVVGIGTPVALAAVLLARELHAPGVGLMMPGALDPAERNLTCYVSNPSAAVAQARTRLSRMAILDAIAQGRVTLQFVRPAEVDGLMRINTELLRTADGDRHLVGPVALPDVLARVGRVVAYLPKHDRSVLVNSVHKVTAPRSPEGPGVAGIVTPLAEFARIDPTTSLVGCVSGIRIDEIRELTGFPFSGERCHVLPEPSARELDVLRTIVDPLGLIGLEDPVNRRATLRTLSRLWSNDPTTYKGDR
jgi:glutaconate CoA-transferase, subunit B